MDPTEPTDRQLRASIYKIALAYLEIERGLRTSDQLERFLTDAEHRRHRNRPSDPRLRTRQVVRPTDIGPIHLDRHLPGQITATLTTRETDQRWGALVLHLIRQHDGLWRIDQLERLRRTAVARQQPPHQPVDLDRRIDQVAEERRLADAAHRATTSRLAEICQPGDVADDEQVRLRQQQQTWQRRRTELDHELGQLRSKRQIHRQLANPDEATCELTHEQLVEVLGPVPDDPWRQSLWTGLTEEISAYRWRWSITDPHTLLGAETDDPKHQQDRDELAATLRAAARELADQPHRTLDHPSDADIARTAGRRYGRGVVAER